jgi:Family of unknown function (DUF6010)
MSHSLPLAAGVIAAVVTALVTSRMPREKARDFYTTFMGATAFVYVGSALAGQTGALTLETAIAIVLFNITLAGQWRSVRFTAVAFLLHGLWDLLHWLKGAGAQAGSSFPALCVAFDWVIAGFIWRLGAADNRTVAEGASGGIKA